MSTSERDAEICASILRGLAATARECEQLAAGWADADQLESLTANAARDAAWDAETASCDAPTIVMEARDVH